MYTWVFCELTLTQAAMLSGGVRQIMRVEEAVPGAGSQRRYVVAEVSAYAAGGGNVRLKDAGQHEAAIGQPSISKFHISHKSIKYYIKNNTFSKIFLGVENRQIFFLL